MSGEPRVDSDPAGDATQTDAAALSFLAGGGEMGKLIATMDWSKTPLGPPESWPPSLRTTLSLCLASNVPLCLIWGPERVQFYNDGYWPICGAKHPRSMGQDYKECWNSAWSVVGPGFERCVATGETTSVTDRRMFLDRNGYLEETFFTYSYSPIRDETGEVAGVFHPVTETTHLVLAQRRLGVLRDLADRTANSTTIDEALVAAASALSEHQLDVPFALMYRVNARGTSASLAGACGLSPGATAAPELIDLETSQASQWPLAAVVSTGKAELVADVEHRFGPLACGPYEESPRAALLLPIRLASLQHPAVILVAGVSPRRALDDTCRGFYDMLAVTVTTAVASAHAYEEKNRRAETLAEIDRVKTADFSNVSHLELSRGRQESARREERLRARELESAALQAEREYLRGTLASIGDAVIATDASGCVNFLNDVARTLTGWTQEEAAGRPLTTVFRILNEETRQPVENPVEKVLREGVIVGLANHTVLVSRDGTEYPITDSAAPIRDAAGNVLGVVMVFRDVTEHRNTQRERQANEERLAFALAAADLGQWDLNLVDHTATRTLRHDQIFGYDTLLPEWTYEKFLEHVLPADRALVDAKFRQAQAGGTAWEIECRIRRADGAERWIWTRAHIQRGVDGQIERMLGIVGDSTDRKQTEEELRKVAADLSEADRRKTEFLATLAHELRNPLAPIRTGLELMRIAGDDREMTEQARVTMEGQTRQLVRLVDDLLDVSRITSGKITLRTERVVLAAVVQSAVEAVRSIIESAGHKLTVTLPPQPVHLQADPTRLTQILSNVLINAAKYTPNGGRIRLAAERQGSQVLVTISDTGIGLAPETLQSIFEMFTQADRTLERSHGGLGIGLTLVKQLVEMHGGSVEAHSEGLGAGSVFSLRLPLLVEQAQETPGVNGETVVQTNRLKVLIVDDNTDAAKMLAMVVRTLGNEVRTATDGLDGIEVAEDFRPDVVLMDLGMPKLNGYEAARRIRQHPWGRQMVLVALTGWGQEDDRQRTKQAGFDHHFVKPVEPDLLRKLLAEHEPNAT